MTMTLDIDRPGPVADPAMVDRLVALAESATDQQWTAGLYWYAAAHGAAYGIADRYAVSVETAAAVIAVLSPRILWDRNVAYAHAVFATGTAPVLKLSRDRAAAIAAGADPADILGGPKVWSFYWNIVDPAGRYAVTVDRHAYDAAVGCRGCDKSRKPLARAGEYQRIANAYRAAADRLGILPSQVQAIVWLVWRDQIGA